jgi:hypothetical protein
MRFHEILEAIERMSCDEQDALLAILERRRVQRRRAIIAEECREARRQLKAGRCRPRTVQSIMRLIRDD